MRYVIYGAGAIGGVIGGRLHRAGLDITLVARGEHLRAIRADGLTLDAPEGSAVLTIPALADASEIGWTDDTVVLLCVKSQQTEAALDDLAAHAPADTPVVSVQNGVSNEPRILRRLARTYAVCVMLPATHLEPGVVVQGSGNAPGILDVGRFPTGVDEVTTAVAADLRSAGFSSQPCDHIMAWKYRKLISNLGNGVDAVAARDEAADRLAALAQQEGESVLAAAGISVATRAQDTERRGDLIRLRTDRPRAGGSTYQSLARGADVEIDHLTGEIVLLGRLHGLATPVNDLVQRTVHDVVRAQTPPATLSAATLLAQLSRPSADRRNATEQARAPRVQGRGDAGRPATLPGDGPSS